MNVPAPNLLFTADHEWLRLEGDGTAVIGITDHAQGLLGDIVFVQLPDVDSRIAKGEQVVVLESVKAAGEINMPVAGRVVGANSALADDASAVNRDPMGDGWFIRIQLEDASDLVGLMSEAQYAAFIGSHD